MKWSALPLSPTPRMLRQFAVAWLAVFALLAAKQGIIRQQPTTGAVLGLFGVAGWLKPGLMRGLFIGATVVTFPIGWLVSQVMLAILFYAVMTPLALLFRLRRRDPLHLRRRADQVSHWHDRDGPPEPARYLKQY